MKAQLASMSATSWPVRGDPRLETSCTRAIKTAGAGVVRFFEAPRQMPAVARVTADSGDDRYYCITSSSTRCLDTETGRAVKMRSQRAERYSCADSSGRWITPGSPSLVRRAT